MPQIQDLLAAFVEFSDTFVDDYDVVEFLHRLAERCVKLVTVSEAGIMLADERGGARCAMSRRQANGCTSSNCSNSNTTKVPAWTPTVPESQYTAA